VIIEKITVDEKLFDEEKNKPLIQEKTLNKCITEILLKPE